MTASDRKPTLIFCMNKLVSILKNHEKVGENELCRVVATVFLTNQNSTNDRAFVAVYDEVQEYGLVGCGRSSS